MKVWTSEELKWLKDNSFKFSIKELSEKLERTEGSVKATCTNNGFKFVHKNPNRLWKPEEIEWLKQNSKDYTAQELAERFNRSVQVIQVQCSKLKIKYIAKNKDAFWSEDDKNFLIHNASEYTILDFVEHFNGKYSEAAISWQRSQLKLSFKRQECFWTEEETEWLLENSHKFTRAELAERFECTEKSVGVKCNLLKIDFKSSEYFWSENDTALLTENVETCTLKELVELFNGTKTETAIELYCNRHKLKFIDGRIHSILNHNFLDNIDTPEKAYFLGWFHTDGHLDINQNQICFLLADREPLELFNQIFSIEQNISEYEAKITNRKNLFKWCLGSQKLSEALQTLGYESNKTFSAKYPKIPDELLYHFYRGCIDGDGCIHIQKDNRGSETIRVNLVGTESLLSTIKHKINATTEVRKNDNIFSWSINGKFAVEVLTKVYANSQGLRLTRKYDIFINYLKSRNLLTPELELSFNSNSLI